MLRLKFTNAGDNKWRWIIYTEQEGVVLLTSPAYETFAAAEEMCVHFLMHVGVMPAQYATVITGAFKEWKQEMAEEEDREKRQLRLLMEQDAADAEDQQRLLDGGL